MTPYLPCRRRRREHFIIYVGMGAETDKRLRLGLGGVDLAAVRVRATASMPRPEFWSRTRVELAFVRRGKIRRCSNGGRDPGLIAHVLQRGKEAC